ncbi:MAG: cysteine peptidase family C39 domain-containing protein [Planctomycetaceae bacterium]|nr:cysteine peptidase family C39 domain-containing protein [Planctomycetaceae bacterium]
MMFSFSVYGDNREFPQEIRDKLFSCGVNSLYLFLNLHGHQTDFETLKSEVTIGDNGTSLYDLQNAAVAVGMPVETVQCSYSTLCSLNMPVIAWINRNPNEANESVIGHFIVLIKADADGIVYLDGTSGEQSSMQLASFAQQWNGMLVRKKENRYFVTDRMALSVFLLGVAFMFLHWGFAPKKIAVAVLACFMFSPLSFCYAEESTRIWRTQENESINALYLLLQINGLPCDYGKLEAELKSVSTTQSLSDIKKHARNWGLNLDVFRCATPDALERISIPFLIHTGGGGDSSDAEWQGNFLLVIGRGHGHYMILNCATIGISEISEESLRRYWSGYVLGHSPRTKLSFVQTPAFLSSMLGLAILLLYWSIAAKKKSSGSVALMLGITLLFAQTSQADENQPPATFTPEQIKEILLETADNLESLKIYYRSEYYTDPKAPPKTYLYRRILAKSPYYLNHTNAHPSEAFSWDNYPMLQQAFIQGTTGYNHFPFRNNYFVMTFKPDDPLPGTLPGEFFFNATGIWPMKERKAPTWEDVPSALRDVAQNIHYDQVRPLQEIVDDRWCHVLYWADRDILWLDMERGAVLLAREVYHHGTGALVFRYELSDHQEAAPGLWIPKKLRNIQFDFAALTEEGRKRRVIDGFFEVEEMEVNTLTEADFDFIPPPGALLTYDAREPNAQYPYQSIPGGEEMLDKIGDWVRTMYPQKKSKPKVDWGWYVGLIVVPIILLLEIRRKMTHAKNFQRKY